MLQINDKDKTIQYRQAGQTQDLTQPVRLYTSTWKAQNLQYVRNVLNSS